MPSLTAMLLDVRRTLLLLAIVVRWWLPYWLLRAVGRAPADAGYRMRRLCEQMGVTYVKLGQYLAIRYDLLPAAVCRELSLLLNEVEPMPFERVRRVVERELGGELDSVFARFDREPVGAASIAQVHRAVSRDGRILAIKVQRPEVEATLRADVRNLRRLARVADRLRLLGAISLLEIVEEVGTFTLREVDFLLEGRTADAIRAEPTEILDVPLVHWDLSTRRLLAMDFVEGISLLEICERAERTGEDAFALMLPGVDAERLVDRLATACLNQLFVTGVFHGDPHPANLIIGRDGAITIIDFGIFGRLAEAQRRALADLMASLTAGRLERAYACYGKLAKPTADTDGARYRLEMLSKLGRWYAVIDDPTVPTADKLSAGFQTQILGVMRRNRVRTEPDQILFWRTLGWLDALAHRLPVELDMLGVMQRFFAVSLPSPGERLERLLLDPEAWTERVEALVRGIEGAPRALSVAPGSGARRAQRVRRAPAASGFRLEPLVLALTATAAALAALSPGPAPAHALLGAVGALAGVGALLALLPRRARRGEAGRAG